ncbi:FAD-dependent oxidoreductase [Hydrogenovibrio thermophilus]|jgi:malate dehydrogenase (quinone)|uniref:malate dehydrogenase (quinone) n=1 Tax=Hydrogenovibrio thermophilus TaxID=265883 RepID=A0A410H522_9GAMM|nr:FAD-dependent oxidoreductase [Hydrogenovibrio thermophilus]QAB16038.1 FAD-dependent oxidoreductase [Hydrogenovibrio thermophilus]
MQNRTFDVVIVGGGITGTALAYTLAKYTDIKSIAILEKYGSLSPLNSNARSNSQTLHCGDIETNYTLEKAISVKRTANMLVKYAEQVDKNDFLYKFPKMILAVGDDECERLEKRHEEFKEGFPYMELWDAEKIAEVEPKVALKDGKPRPERILASGCTDEYSAVNYGNLSKSFIDSARKTGKDIRVSLSSKVDRIIELEDHYELQTAHGTYVGRFVVVSAGAHSLLLANQLGHGMNLSTLPMAGSFYFAPKVLNGKVYTMQNDKLPFAALHGDPDLTEPDKTRLGPTALVLPKLERYTGGTYMDFWRSLKLDTKVLRVFWDLMKDSTIRNYIFRNFLFEVPWLNKKLFVKDARKILPDLTTKDLTYAEGYGGVRPQVIDKTTKELKLGEASIVPEHDNIIFNMTPSPGATTCLGNAYRDAKIICERLGVNLKHDELVNDLLDGKDL